MDIRVRTALLCLCFSILLLQSEVQAAPVKKNRFYFEKRGEIVWEVRTGDKLIALTFDDGPDPKETPAILDLLRQYDAQATFFPIGRRVQKYPELAKREAAEGHELANHTLSHVYFTKQTSADTMRREIEGAEQTIKEITGQQPRLFRPPGGFYDEHMVKVARDAGYLVVLWSWTQDTRDWNRPGVGRIVSRVLKNAKSGDIVLFHDHVGGNTQTIEALRKILPELRDRGFRFVTVSELLAHSKIEPVRNKPQK